MPFPWMLQLWVNAHLLFHPICPIMKHRSGPKGAKKMAKPWQRPLIARCKQSILEILREVEATDDLDLWEELDGKASDVLIVYRRAHQQQAQPATFTFSDGTTRDLDVMAAAHAVAEVFPELDQDDEFPAFMGRGERGA